MVIVYTAGDRYGDSLHYWGRVFFAGNLVVYHPKTHFAHVYGISSVSFTDKRPSTVWVELLKTSHQQLID